MKSAERRFFNGGKYLECVFVSVLIVCITEPFMVQSEIPCLLLLASEYYFVGTS